MLEFALFILLSGVGLFLVSISIEILRDSIFNIKLNRERRDRENEILQLHKAEYHVKTIKPTTSVSPDPEPLRASSNH